MRTQARHLAGLALLLSLFLPAVADARRVSLWIVRVSLPDRGRVKTVWYVGPAKVAGRVFAYSDEYAGRSSSSSYVFVRDGLTGRELLHVQSGLTCDPTYQAGPVSSLVLRADGAVAWIVGGCTSYPATTYEVRTPNGVLASGTDIDRESLALTADGITWEQGGTTHSAPL